MFPFLGMSEYFVSKRGRDFIMAQEYQHKVAIRLLTKDQIKAIQENKASVLVPMKGSI